MRGERQGDGAAEQGAAAYDGGPPREPRGRLQCHQPIFRPVHGDRLRQPLVPTAGAPARRRRPRGDRQPSDGRTAQLPARAALPQRPREPPHASRSRHAQLPPRSSCLRACARGRFAGAMLGAGKGRANGCARAGPTSLRAAGKCAGQPTPSTYLFPEPCLHSSTS